MKVPMVDLKANYQPIKKEIDEAINSVLNKTNFILGDDVSKFEGEFASYCGTKYAIGVANGTDAVRIALMAAGVKKGNEVITTPFTFIATTESIVQAGLTAGNRKINNKLPINTLWSICSVINVVLRS